MKPKVVKKFLSDHTNNKLHAYGSNPASVCFITHPSIHYLSFITCERRLCEGQATLLGTQRLILTKMFHNRYQSNVYCKASDKGTDLGEAGSKSGGGNGKNCQ